MDANLEQALNPRKFPLFAVRGCAGSGKSTFAEKLKQAIERKSALVSGPYSEVKIFENDEFFIDPVTKEYKFDRDLCPIAAQWTLGRVANTLHLHQKTPCIVANTFTTFPELEPYMKLASYFRVWLVVFRMRDFYGSIHNVPDEVIKEMQERLSRTRFKGEIWVDAHNEDHIVNQVAEWVVSRR